MVAVILIAQNAMDENERMLIKLTILLDQYEKLNIDARIAVAEEKVKRLESIIFYVMGIAGGGVITGIMALVLK